MKSTFSKFLTLKLVLISLFMIGLSVVVTPSVQAQSSLTDGGFASLPPGTTYVSPATAIARLDEQCISLKAQVAFYNSSSQEYKLALAKYKFFSIILEQLHAGRTTEESLITGLNALQTDVIGTLSKQKLQEYKTEAIELLKA